VAKGRDVEDAEMKLRDGRKGGAFKHLNLPATAAILWSRGCKTSKLKEMMLRIPGFGTSGDLLLVNRIRMNLSINYPR